MKYPTQLDLQREDDSIMCLLYIVITYISYRDDEERSDITRLCCSWAWVSSLHSPSCGVKGFALILGSTERDFLRLALEVRSLPRLRTVSAESDGICTNEAQTLRDTSAVFPPHVIEQISAALHSLSVSDALASRCDWAVIAENRSHELMSPLYTLTLRLIYLSLCSHHCFPSTCHIFILFLWKLQLVYIPAVEL